MLRDIVPVTPIELPLADALHCIAAGMPAAAPRTRRMTLPINDGWAMRANDLVGASSYAPLALTEAPVWVEAGHAMPDGTDCVVDADAVDSLRSDCAGARRSDPGAGRPACRQRYRRRATVG